MKTSFIATVFNEENTIGNFIKSIFLQTKIPDEIIIVDGGSTDNTLSAISNLRLQISSKQMKLKIIVKKGNRAIGRNEAIKRARGDLILISDAGCILKKDWVEKITEPFINLNVDVVAGYYDAKTETIFQKCLVPYVLVMSDRVNPKRFLPATRSMALRKKIWKKIGGFNEKFSHNEDYVFARKLKDKKINIFFEKKAIVYWIPRKNIKESFIMFFRFSFGDIEAKIIRPKVSFLFLRYFLGITLLIFYIYSKIYFSLYFLFLLFIFYLSWSILKNFKYIKDIRAVFILPFMQILSDIAIILGSLSAFFSSL